MKHTILRYPVLFCLMLVLNKSYAQTNHFFAVTGKEMGMRGWSFMKAIDLSGKMPVQALSPSSANDMTYLDALSGISPASFANVRPAKDSIAAIAYDSKYNRLYFTFMHGTDLRYFDLNNAAVKPFVVTHQQLKQFQAKPGEEDVITRMTFASDGYGYALTNNGNHLIRFSTGQKITIQDLGSLVDGKNNAGNSVHSPCTSWGGDMIADAFGNLYLVTQRANVYKINPKTLVTDYVGVIKNIPADFTVNGTAADEDNTIVISCALKAANYYRFNLTTLEATIIPGKEEQMYNASDLAGSYLLYQNLATKKIDATEVKGNANISVYPNPVTGRSFSVSFSNVAKGNYSVELLDAAGRRLFNKVVNVVSAQTERIYLPANVNSGAFIIRVINMQQKNKIYTDKIVVGQ